MSTEARNLIRSAVITLVRAGGGQMVTRPLIRSDPGGRATQEPEPVAGIAAAVALKRAARQQCLESVRYAREDGHGWGRIGEALGYADDPGPGMTSVAERAFGAVASDLGSGPVFTWTCPGCRQAVIDRGPEAGHPEDQEQGHAERCGRLAEAVRAWEAQWKDEGDEH